jgi:XRE family transcriptional regulator, regulator of sulfur utilization
MKNLSLAFLAAAALVAPVYAQDPVLGSAVVSWDEIQAGPTSSNGMSKQVWRQRTATLDELEVHITALPPGKTTHPPHTHPNEEILVIREGTLEVYQNGKTRRVGPGSIIFHASNDSHNVTNVGDTTAAYHVINWKSPGMAKPKAVASAEDAVKAFYREWRKATAEQGAQGYAAYFAEDAVLLPPDAPPVTGRRAILEWQERSQKESPWRTLPETLRADEVEVAGDLALSRSTLQGTRVAKAGGEGEPFEAKYFDVLRHKADGQWELVRRMWSSNRSR